MAINQAIIRIRRGLKDELQIDKLLPGELAMATDAPCMWFCWSPGEVEQIPTTGNVIEHISQIVTEYIANNDISVIGKVFMRIYNGWVQYSPDEKTWKNVISLADIKGDEGGYYIPVINNNGIISWQPSQDGMEELQDSLILSKEIIESVLGYVPLKNTDVVDNLVSTATKLPLSAKQGGVLDAKKANVGAMDFSSMTLAEITQFISNQPNMVFVGKCKLRYDLSPTGTTSWCRCIFTGQNAANSGYSVDISIIAMSGSNIWQGEIYGSAEHTLIWNKLVRESEISALSKLIQGSTGWYKKAVVTSSTYSGGLALLVGLGKIWLIHTSGGNIAYEIIHDISAYGTTTEVKSGLTLTITSSDNRNFSMIVLAGDFSLSV